MKKILILGGYGFLGKNLNKILEQSSFQIFNESRRTNCDMLNYISLYNKIKEINPDIIIHSAAHVGSVSYVANNTATVVFDNTQMYLNLYKAVSEINSNIIIINPISNCSYPGDADIQIEEDWWNGPIHSSVESYGYPKKMGYVISECFKEQHNIKTINLIIPNAYGPYDYTDENKTHALNGIVLRMLRCEKNKEKDFIVWGTGNPIREWIYMPDVAKFIINLIEENNFDIPNPINIGQKKGFSINESVNSIKNLLNYNFNIIHDVSKLDGAPIKILDNSKFKYVFPEFKFTDINTGLKNTINYYKELI